MKNTLIISSIFFITSITNAQKLIWPSSFGGVNGGGSIVSYDLVNNSLNEIAELESNSLGMYHLYSNNYEVSNEYHDLPTEGNGLYFASDGYVYGIDQYVGLNASNGQQGLDGGLLYRFHPDTLTIEPLHYFQKSRYWEDDRFEKEAYEKSYSSPRLGVMEAAGKLYGFCIKGGSDNHGGVWNFDLNTLKYSQLKDFENNQTGIGFDPSSPLCFGPDNDLFFTLAASQGIFTDGGLIKIDVSEDTVGYVYNLQPKVPGFTTLGIYFPNGKLIYDPVLQRFYGAKKYDFYPNGGGVYMYDFNPSGGSLTNVINNVGIFNDYPLLGSNAEGMIQGNDAKKYIITTKDGNSGHGCLLVYSHITKSITRLTNFLNSPNGNSLFVHGTKIWGTYLFKESDIPTHSLWSYDVTNGILTNHIPTNSIFGKRIEPQIAMANDGIYMVMKSADDEGSQNIVKFDYASETASLVVSGASNSSKMAIGSLIDIGNGELLGLSKNYAPGLGYSHQEGCLIKYNLNTNTSTLVKPIQSVSSSYISSVMYSPLVDNNPQLILGNNNKVYFSSNSVGNQYYGFLDPSFQARKILWEYDISTNKLAKVDSVNLQFWGPTGTPNLLENGNIAYTLSNQLRIYNPTLNQINNYTSLMNEDEYGVFNGSLLEASDGNLYGITSKSEDFNLSAKSSIFKLNSTNNYEFTVLHQFDSLIIQANEGLVEHNGILYGSTASGGDNNQGYLFSFDTGTNAFTIIHSFFKAQDGADFEGIWQLVNDSLIGVSSTGGANNFGTLAMYDISDNQFSVLEDLNLKKGFSYKTSPILLNDLTLSLNEYSTENNFSIFPNPSNGTFEISGIKYNEIEIIDLQGRTILKASKKIKYSLKEKGFFIIRLYNNKELVGVKKLILK